MALEKLIMTELNALSLAGVSIGELTITDDTVSISFEINKMVIHFIASSKVEPKVLKLILDGQTHTDDETLKKCDEWTKYVWAMIKPTVEKYMKNLTISNSQAKKVPLTEQNTDIIAKERVEKAEEKKEAEVENLAKTAVESSTDKTIEEAMAAGHKEGYKVARTKNAHEMRALKQKYHIIIILMGLIIAGLVVALFVL